MNYTIVSSVSSFLRSSLSGSRETISQSFKETDESDLFQSFDIKFVEAIDDLPLLPIDELPLDLLLLAVAWDAFRFPDK